MNPAPPMIESLRIRGFRSLDDIELSGLSPATVLIGPNGSGKSNILRFLDLLRYMLRHRALGWFVERQGGAADQLFSGEESADRIICDVTLNIGDGWYDYRFVLEYAHPDRFFFSEEMFRPQSEGHRTYWWQHLGRNHHEANLVLAAQSNEFPDFDQAAAAEIVNVLGQCVVYQFHNTGGRSYFMRSCDVSDNDRLYTNGGNLAAVLYRIEREDLRCYERICRYIGQILPGFARFDLEENQGKVALRWQSNWSNRSFGAHLTSDGSLRLFALITLLNMPPEMQPAIILLDEPELGLHPAAFSLIGGMIRSLSTRKQIIIATQSPLLVDDFGLDQTIVLELRKGRTEVHKYDPDEYQHWLDDYTTGELWEKNLLGGRP